MFSFDNHGNFECFLYFNFETNFLRNENLFQKTGVRFLVESTIHLEGNVKTNRMRRPITKNRALPVITYFFEKNFSHIKC